MLVYVIRHGQSESNLSKTRCGWYDAALTPKGEQDAEKAGKLIRGIAFDKIYSSDLARAQKTAQIALPNCIYETTDLIREISVGKLVNQPISLTDDEQKAYFRRYGYAEHGGESTAQFRSRTEHFMQKLETEQADNVAVFCHEGVLRTMLDIVMGMDMPRDNICCNNCAIAVFEYTDKWRLFGWHNF